MQNNLSFILIGKYFKCLFQVILFLSLASCYTLNSHQTGKTLGKGNFEIATITGLSDIPNYDKEELNKGNGFIMIPNITYQYGVGNTTDIGLFAGAAKTGLLFKQQFLGSKESKGAVSIGVNAFVGLEAYAILYSYSYAKIELPLYLSWEFSERLAVYASPVALYSWEKEEGSYPENISTQYFSKGLILGCMIKFGARFTISPEMAVQTLQEIHTYQFYSTIGFGMRF